MSPLSRLGRWKAFAGFVPLALVGLLPLAVLALDQAAAPAGSSVADLAMRQRQVRDEQTSRCLQGQSGQARSSCLREVEAAYAEARQGRLGNGPILESPAALAANAEARCARQLPDDRADCLSLSRGAGQRSGSVASGFVIKEMRRTLPPVQAASAGLPSKGRDGDR
ncbi:hypothetical protein RQP53_00320 [Paucibacter sp. APW11]|uniref:Lysozyme inhibitor LprI N-terminal domain-containing protein n=1 Tax=Roseateles aquae TaxID=3077235 RepID=A0ABU3P566_9BURK|nr:hypothetical protein [Paucibacter sp. APW11]MDT8997712.1 hypothetical protein [Paucibacter sp. APW11]